MEYERPSLRLPRSAAVRSTLAVTEHLEALYCNGPHSRISAADSSLCLEVYISVCLCCCEEFICYGCARTDRAALYHLCSLD
jgi:hypothetical protein